MRQLDLNDSRAPKIQKKSKVKLSFSDISDDKNSATNTSLCSGKSELYMITDTLLVRRNP